MFSFWKNKVKIYSLKKLLLQFEQSLVPSLYLNIKYKTVLIEKTSNVATFHILFAQNINFNSKKDFLDPKIFKKCKF